LNFLGDESEAQIKSSIPLGRLSDCQKQKGQRFNTTDFFHPNKRRRDVEFQVDNLLPFVTVTMAAEIKFQSIKKQWLQARMVIITIMVCHEGLVKSYFGIC